MPSTALPIPSAAPAPVAAPASSPNAADGSDAAPAEDFMSMLTELLVGPASPAPNAAAAAGTLTKQATDEAQGEMTDAALLAMGLPIVAMQPTQQAAPATGQSASDLLESLDLLNGSRGKNGEALGALLGGKLSADLLQPVAAKETDAVVTPNLAAHLADPSTGLRSATDPLTRPLQAPVGTQAWTEELNTRMTWMVERGHHSASLRLTPEHLGPLEVRISVRDEQASVWFGAAHADTRAAIEQALPKLRELFAAQGMSLADAGVFREPPRDQNRNPLHANAQSSAEDFSRELSLPQDMLRMGLVDAYA